MIAAVGPAWLLACAAQAGELDAQLGVDGFGASSVNEAAGAGDPDAFSAAEIGLRVRADLRELDDRLTGELDYRGREPVAGAFPNDALRLLYVGELAYQVVEDRVEVGAGRFLAPTIVLLPMDGARLSLSAGRTTFGAFAGRRGITTSRRNLALSEFLPAAGLSLTHVAPKLLVDATAAYAEDQLLFSSSAAGEHTEDVAGPLAHARATWIADDAVAVGGQASFASQATYILGPTWSEHTLEVTALDLWNALGWVDWRPKDVLRIDYSALGQSVALYGSGLAGEALEDVREPRFLDNRLRASVAPLGTELGWVRADVRHRLRHDRTEVRYGGSVELNRIVIEGPFARAGAQIDDLVDAGDPAAAGAVDRLYWNASVGWNEGPLQAEVGASVTDRAAAPVSGRQLDPANPGGPVSSEDLAPFVLEAQEVWFVRGFYSGRSWFGGVDLERSLDMEGDSPEGGEVRAFVQVGVLTRAGW